MRKLSTKTVAVTAAVFTIATAGVAYAYWTETGSGTGSASADRTQPVVVNQTSTVAGLFPGGAAQTLSGTFNNPNPGAVHLGAVSVASVSTDKAGCTASDFTIGGSANVDAEIASGNGVGSWSGLTIRMVDSSADQDACKGATVTLNYTVS